MDMLHLPDPLEHLPAEWQPYARWLAAQANPPKSYRDHPFASEQELLAVQKVFERRMGLSLGQYVRLKRVANLLAQSPGTGSGLAESAALGVFAMRTPLGQMLAVFGTQGLCLLEFPERKAVESELLAVRKALQANFVWNLPAHADTARALQQELDAYFAGTLRTFATPLAPVGTPFQQQVWRGLQSIPYGHTRSYKAQAEDMSKPAAVRAVAAANGCNKISILIPCHRVIGSDGSLTGYGGGLERKRALLALEKAILV